MGAKLSSITEATKPMHWHSARLRMVGLICAP